jgi:hypothetical protein
MYIHDMANLFQVQNSLQRPLLYIIFSRILKTVFYTVDLSENRKKIQNKGARLQDIKKGMICRAFVS